MRIANKFANRNHIYFWKNEHIAHHAKWNWQNEPMCVIVIMASLGRSTFRLVTQDYGQ